VSESYEEKANFVDKTKYSEIWALLIRNALLAKVALSLPEYRRNVDALILSLVEKERIQAIKYKNEIIQKNPARDINELYDYILQFCIDLLNNVGYLTKQSSVEVYGGPMDNKEEGE